MGIVSKQLSQSNNMKFLLVLAVAAYARAEADPGFAYSVGAAPLVYNHLPVAYHHPLAYHHVPLVYAAAAGCRNNEGSLVPCAHGVLPALAPLAAAAAPAEAAEEAVVSVEKREADPEADPWLYYHGLGYAGLHPYGYGYHGLGYAYAGYGYHPYAYGGYGCRNGYGALVPCAGR